MTRTCRHCNVDKEISEFYKGKYRCKECYKAQSRKEWADSTPEEHRARVDKQLAYQQTDAGKEKQRRARLKFRYGITEDQYDFLLEEQDHKCFLCGEDERVPHHSSGELMNLAVDHDHRCCDEAKSCGKCVRGLLCYNCNRFMGRVDRSPKLAARFTDYISRRPLEPKPEIYRAPIEREDGSSIPAQRLCWNSGKGGHLCNKKCADEPPYGTTLEDLVAEAREKQFRQYAEWSDKQIRQLYEGRWT